MRALFGLLLLLMSLLVAGQACAQEPKAALIVTRDEGSRDCLDAEAMAARIDAIVGRKTVQAGSDLCSGTCIQIELTRAFDGYRAAIQTRGERSGSRIISDV